MKLMRNMRPDGQCKYAAVRMDKLTGLTSGEQHEALTALMVLNGLGVLENPRPGEREEFFLIKLKDRNAPVALSAYAARAQERDHEFAGEVRDLATRAGINHPWSKEPD